MALHRFAQLVAAATVVLITAGALVTSTDSGLAVPDWPTTYGWSMFTFPLSKMVGGILYEHGHRLIASTVGGLTIVLAAWLWWTERRRWVAGIGAIAVAVVIAQGILGGITVLYFLPPAVSIAHAGLAQIFLCLAVALAVLTSPGWSQTSAQTKDARPPATDDRVLRRLTTLTVVVVYAQILVGATMRHTGAGLAIPDFPLAFGRLMPPISLLSTGPVAIHFAHRIGAIVTAFVVLATAGRVWAHHRSRPALIRPAALLVALVLAQIGLGGLTVLSAKAVAVNTAHVTTGALVLATSLVLALRAHRGLLADVNDRVEATRPGRLEPDRAQELAASTTPPATVPKGAEA